MASWISSTLSSLSLPASSAKGSGEDVYSWLQPLVNISFNLLLLSWYWIEHLSWFLQGCLSFGHSKQPVLPFIQQPEILKLHIPWSLWYVSQVIIYLPSIMTLIFCCATEVLFYAFCEYISAFFFFFLLSSHTDINFADDVRIFK